MYEDIYFLDSKEALKVATEQNRWGGELGYNLQICYYDGDKIDSDLPNLLHLPINNLLEGLVYERDRIPSTIDFTGLDISYKVQMEILAHFNNTIEQAKNYRAQFNTQYLQEIKKLKLDFNEPLRFYLMASDRTMVMQFVSKNIADTLQDMGYEVLFDLYNGTEDMNCFKKIYEFKPHATININHYNNTFLSDDVFNFVWFQDPMSHMHSGDVYIRKRDYIYSLNYVIDDILRKNNIEFTRQGFCANERVFFDYKKPRENKIIFVGSSLVEFEKTFSDDAYKVFHLLKNDIQNRPLKITKQYLQELSNEYDLTYDFILTQIYPHSLRELCVEYICTQDKIKAEVYGRYWDKNDIVKPFFKGEVPHGEKIVEIYNSAKFALAGVHPYEKALQRFPEVVACGAIPVMYNIEPFINEEYEYDDIILKFNTFEELVSLLEVGEKSGNFDQAMEDMSFKKFANTIVKTIEEATKREQK
ncbi:glycosyltransferase family protein [Sulfurimonas sp.]